LEPDTVPASDPRIDAYVAASAAFARPILRHLRKAVHRACPEVEETVKWSHPSFVHHGILCGMAAFKEHCTFGFWKQALILNCAACTNEPAMGQFGRITRLQDLPADEVLMDYIRKAAQLNEAGIKAPRPRARPKPPPQPPEDLTRALSRNRKALATFEAFSPSNRREYIDWINESKRELTRSKRLAEAVQWMAQGKPRNWKYINC
jgi:uncharacterized protein YdeI (YjbR/CyaY-like superfamily)